MAEQLSPVGRLSPALSGASVEKISGAVHAEVLERGTRETRALLDGLGLCDENGLADAALDIYDAAYVYSDRDRLRTLCRSVHLSQAVTQALLQALHGRSPMGFAGVLHLLARHRLVRVDEPGTLRRFLSTLNEVGLVVWSKKDQTVRAVVADDLVQVAPRIRVIQPDRPYTNVIHLRHLIRECQGFVWWAEPHLNHKALEPLAAEVDPTRVSEIRLLSGPVAIDDTTRRDWRRFKREMAEKSIAAEWRVLPKHAVPFHDRYIIGREEAWNVPPINSLYKGSYAEATRCDKPPPFGEWWSGAPLLEQLTVAA